MTAILLCGNGEPDSHLWRAFGPFEGSVHANLWLRAVHQQGHAPCLDMRHIVHILEKPWIPMAMLSAEAHP